MKNFKEYLIEAATKNKDEELNNTENNELEDFSIGSKSDIISDIKVLQNFFNKKIGIENINNNQFLRIPEAGDKNYNFEKIIENINNSKSPKAKIAKNILIFAILFKCVSNKLSKANKGNGTYQIYGVNLVKGGFEKNYEKLKTSKEVGQFFSNAETLLQVNNLSDLKNTGVKYFVDEYSKKDINLASLAKLEKDFSNYKFKYDDEKQEEQAISNSKAEPAKEQKTKINNEPEKAESTKEQAISNSKTEPAKEQKTKINNEPKNNFHIDMSMSNDEISDAIENFFGDNGIITSFKKNIKPEETVKESKKYFCEVIKEAHPGIYLKNHLGNIGRFSKSDLNKSAREKTINSSIEDMKAYQQDFYHKATKLKEIIISPLSSTIKRQKAIQKINLLAIDYKGKLQDCVSHVSLRNNYNEIGAIGKDIKDFVSRSKEKAKSAIEDSSFMRAKKLDDERINNEAEKNVNNIFKSLNSKEKLVFAAAVMNPTTDNLSSQSAICSIEKGTIKPVNSLIKILSDISAKNKDINLRNESEVYKFLGLVQKSNWFQANKTQITSLSKQYDAYSKAYNEINYKSTQILNNIKNDLNNLKSNPQALNNFKSLWTGQQVQTQQNNNQQAQQAANDLVNSQNNNQQAQQAANDLVNSQNNNQQQIGSASVVTEELDSNNNISNIALLMAYKTNPVDLNYCGLLTKTFGNFTPKQIANGLALYRYNNENIINSLINIANKVAGVQQAATVVTGDVGAVTSQRLYKNIIKRRIGF